MISKYFNNTIRQNFSLVLPILSILMIFSFNAVAQTHSQVLSEEITYYDGNLYPCENKIYNGIDYQTTYKVLTRDQWGNVTESKDQNGIHTITDYEADGTRVAATYVLATNDETNILNFEDGTVGNWSYWTNGEISTVAHTGSKGYYLKGDIQRHVTKKITVDKLNTSKKYILAGWVKTTSTNPLIYGYVKYNNGSSSIYPLSKHADGTGDWQYLEGIIDLSLYPNITYICVYVFNGTTTNFSEAWWDDVRFYPENSPRTALTYDPVTLQVTSKTDENGVKTNYRYNGFGVLTEEKNDDGAALSLTTQSYSSERHGGDFWPSDPNYVESAAFANGNYVNNWSFEEMQSLTAPSGWIIQDAVTSFENDSYVGAKSLRVYRNNLSVVRVYQNLGFLKKGKTYTASAWFKAQSGSRARLFFGDGWTDVNNPVQYENYNSTYVTGDGTWNRIAVTITINSSHDDMVWVFIYDPDNTGVLYDGVIVEEASTASMPQISRTYTDGLGRTLQTHVRDGANDIISAVEYDEAGRQYRTYRPYPNASRAYDAAYESHALSYSSYTDAPYSETVYDNDPLSRVRESVPSGAEYTDEIVSKSYGSAAISGYQYAFEQTRMKPGDQNNWMISKKYADKLGRVVRTESRAENGSGSVIASTAFYKMTGQPYCTIDPNGFAAYMEYDFFGRMTSKTTVDAGISKFAYDKTGKLRFMVDAEGITHSNVLYWKYDVLGRVIEKGYIAGASWGDGLTWKSYAENTPDYPTSQQNTWRKKYTYDAPGCKGSLWTVETNNDDDNTAEVLETFYYDKYGKVTQKDIVVPDYDDTPTAYSTLYAYDYLGRVKNIIYPGSFSVRYSYNHLGQSTKVGTGRFDDYFASYTYNVDGTLKTETLNNGGESGKQALTQNTYGHRRGWLTNISTTISGTTLFDEAMTYTEGGYSGTGYYNGSIASANFNVPTIPSSAVPPTQSYSVTYQYDNFGRMITADNALDNTVLNNVYDLGLGTTPIVYDNNGNFKSVKEGSVTRTYNYVSGTNKATSAGGGSIYTYDLNGNITVATQPTAFTSPAKNLSSVVYDPFTLMTMSVTTPSQTMKYEYDGKKERVLEINQTSGSKMLYLHGMNDYPIMTKSSTDRTYIYGPRGILAMNSGGTWYYAIKDHLGSTRVVMNGTTGVGVEWRDYSALGATMRAVTTAGLSYQFTGQEFDEETGLHNFRARMYDNYLGSFYAMDPAGQGNSPYAYCGGNPVMYVDKDGRIFWFAVGFIIGFEVVGASENNWNFNPSKWKPGTMLHAIGGGLIGGFGLSGLMAGTMAPSLTATVKGIGAATAVYGASKLKVDFNDLNIFGGDNDAGGASAMAGITINEFPEIENIFHDNSSGSDGPSHNEFQNPLGDDFYSVSLKGYTAPAANYGSFNIDKAVEKLDEIAESDYVGYCAKHVRIALEAGGLNTDGRPNLAYQYSTYLPKIGFTTLSSTDYLPLKGDIAVMEASNGKYKHPAGHIQMYNGTQWVSDTKQRNFWPYQICRPSYKLFRWR